MCILINRPSPELERRLLPPPTREAAAGKLERAGERRLTFPPLLSTPLAGCRLPAGFLEAVAAASSPTIALAL